MDFVQQGLVKLPPNLDLQGLNVGNEWTFWKQSFEDFLVTTGQDEAADKVKLSLLRNMMGPEAARIVATFPLSTTDCCIYNKVIEAIDNYAKPRTNVVFDRFLFNKRKQEEGEIFDSFLTDSRRLLKSCQFSDNSGEPIENQLLRDKIVHGVRDKNVQEALLRQDNLSLEKAIKFCQTSEQSKQQVEKLNSCLQEISVVHSKESKKKNKDNVSVSFKQSKFLCTRCQTEHGKRECPAFGKFCQRCGKKNHFAISCRVKNVKFVEEKSTSESDVGSDVDSNINCWTLNTVQNQHNNVKGRVQGNCTNSWSEKILIEDMSIKCKLDTGADVSVMPLKIFKKISKSAGIKPIKTNVRLQGFDGSKSTPVGRVNLKCEYNDKVAYEDFMIVNGTSMLLGLPGCIALNLVQRISSVVSQKTNNEEADKFIKDNKEVFAGSGKFPHSFSISLKEKNPNIFHPPKRIPQMLMDPLKKELNRLQSRNAIVKVDQISPNACVNKVVIVEKTNGKIRLCLDPRDLNEVIVRKPKVMPTLEEVASKLKNKKYFSVFDLSEGFHHMPLTEESSWKCCFATPFGVYRYVVLPFGLSNAPEEFQDAVEKYFGDIENVLIWMDDILVAGENKKKHDEAVSKVVQRAREVGVVFNKDKLQFCKTEVKYIGQIFDQNGMRIDPSRVETLQKLDPPNNKEELQRIIGSFNYVRKYVPKMAELMSPLCKLLKKDSTWIWTSLQQNAFEEMKKVISQALSLTPFDSTKKIILQCDASKNGIGSCMFQEHGGQLKLVACVSRQMNTSELNYSQSEKEMLAIYFGCTKFHRFIYGLADVHVYTDHKPLTNIMNKHIGNIGSIRLQRFRLKLLRYNINLIYVPGKSLHFPDMLSRNSNKETEEDPEMLEMVHSVSRHSSLSPEQKTRLRLATAMDAELSKVQDFCRNGWPKDLKLSPSLVPFAKIKDNLYTEEGILFFGSKIVVPASLRKVISNALHNGHPGITKTLQKARQLYFWPKMSKDLQETVKMCRSCEKFSKRDTNEPLLPHTVPELRFQKVSCDILEFGQKIYLVLIDYFSHWIELRPLKSKSSSSIINEMQDIFTRFGYPQDIIADNNPFSSLECRNYYRSKGITITTSTPHYPKSNGMSEKAVGICKSLLRKSFEGNQDVREYLLHYNNTPIPGLHCSPSQILNSRILRTELPVSSECLQPFVQVNIPELLKIKQGITKHMHDRHRLKKELKYKEGDNIVFRTRNDSFWQKGTILKKSKEPRSYYVSRYGDGKCLRRNTSQIKKSFTTSAANDRFSPPELLLDQELDSPHSHQNPDHSGMQSAPPQVPVSEHVIKTSRYGRPIITPSRLNL